MDCFGAYFTHAQSCDNVCVQSATAWTASVHTDDDDDDDDNDNENANDHDHLNDNDCDFHDAIAP